MAPRPVRSSFRMPVWPYAIVRYHPVIRDKPVKDSNGASRARDPVEKLGAQAIAL